MNAYTITMTNDNFYYELRIVAATEERAVELAEAFEARSDYTESDDAGDYDVDKVCDDGAIDEDDSRYGAPQSVQLGLSGGRG